MEIPHSRLPVIVEERALQNRARVYEERCAAWLRNTSHSDAIDDNNALTIVNRFSPFIALQVRGACMTIDAREREAYGDRNRCAEVALIAIERSRVAWLRLVTQRTIRPHLAEPFVSDLVWLKHEIEQAFPEARLATRRVRDSGDACEVIPTM